MGKEITTVTQRWDITYEHAAGQTGGKFLTELGNNKIVGLRCPKCKRVIVPARSFCDLCFESTTEWVEVEKEGTIETFTVIYRQFMGYPPPPIALAYVRPDGADTAMLTYIKGVDVSDSATAWERLKPGTRVRAVFRDDPEGRITDVWFEPL